MTTPKARFAGLALIAALCAGSTLDLTAPAWAGWDEAAAAHKRGDTFKDCNPCPEMVIVPPGSFRMGDLHGIGYFSEKPIRAVRIDHAFAVGKFEVTFDEWAACVSDGFGVETTSLTKKIGFIAKNLIITWDILTKLTGPVVRHFPWCPIRFRG